MTPNIMIAETPGGRSAPSYPYEAARIVYWEHFSASGITVCAATRLGRNTGHGMEDTVQMLKHGTHVLIRNGDIASKKVGFSGNEISAILDQELGLALTQALAKRSLIDTCALQRQLHQRLRNEIRQRSTNEMLAVAMEATILACFRDLASTICEVELSGVGDGAALHWARHKKLWWQPWWTAENNWQLKPLLEAQRSVDGQQPRQLLGSFRFQQPTICPHSIRIGLQPGQMILIGSDGTFISGHPNVQFEKIIDPVRERWELASAALAILEAARLQQVELARQGGYMALDDQSITLIFREEVK